MLAVKKADLAAPERQFAFLDRWSVLHLLSILLFSLGSSIVTPFFGIYIAKTLGFGIGFAALLISFKVVSQRALSVIGGVLTDVYGAKPVALLGVITRLIAFAILLFPPQKELLIVSAVLNGLGSAVYHPALRKLIFSRFRDSPQLLSTAVSLRNASLNLGAAIGPLLGLLIVESNFQIAFQLIVFIYAVNAGLLLVFRDESKTGSGWHSLKSWRELFAAHYLKIIALQFAFFWSYSHFELLMPIFFNDRFGGFYVALAFVTNTCAVLLVQTIFSKRISLASPWIGFTGFAGFFLICTWISHSGSLDSGFDLSAATKVVGAMLCFSLGEIILSNRVDFMISSQVSAHLTATAFGAAALAGGIALSIANFVNTKIVSDIGMAQVWIFNLAIAVLFVFSSLVRSKK
jgi:DHA1 family multidrug resistance protein-like MFS transporter